MTRFRDAGLHLASFADEILVVCPRCAACARVVAPLPPAPGIARLRCPACAYSAEAARPMAAWGGPWRVTVRIKRCGGCTRPSQVTSRRRTRAGDGSLSVACPRCDHRATRTGEWSPVVPRHADPWFGQELFLLAWCGAHALWAYNLRHLAYVEALVGATLREERRVRVGQSLISRLPRWMTAAAARPAVLRAAARLRGRLLE